MPLPEPTEALVGTDLTRVRSQSTCSCTARVASKPGYTHRHLTSQQGSERGPGPRHNRSATQSPLAVARTGQKQIALEHFQIAIRVPLP